jgi:hypothetical protein
MEAADAILAHLRRPVKHTRRFFGDYGTLFLLWGRPDAINLARCPIWTCGINTARRLPPGQDVLGCSIAAKLTQISLACPQLFVLSTHLSIKCRFPVSPLNVTPSPFHVTGASSRPFKPPHSLHRSIAQSMQVALTDRSTVTGFNE